MEIRTKKCIVNLEVGQIVLLDKEPFPKKVMAILPKSEIVYFAEANNEPIIKTFEQLQDIVIDIIQIVDNVQDTVKKSKSIWQKIKDFFKSFKI